MYDFNSERITFVTTDSAEYKRFNSKYREIQKKIRPLRDKNASFYNKNLYRWELIMLRIFSSMSSEFKQNIIKYPCANSGYKFREVDYISKVEDKLIFVELKLKNNYQELNYKGNGWRQLDISLNLARQKKYNASGLSVCVDMSSIYDIDMADGLDPLNYTPISVLKKKLSEPSKDGSIIWLDAQDVISYGMSLDILCENDIYMLKNAHQCCKEPLQTSYFDPSYTFVSPFSELRSQVSFS